MMCDGCGPGWFDHAGHRVMVLYDVYDLMAELNVDTFQELLDWIGVETEIWRNALVVNGTQMVFPFTVEELEEVIAKRT